MSVPGARSTPQSLPDGASRDQAIQERIQAAARVNATLYAEVERHIGILERTEQERDAWAAHAKGLAQKLVQARKQIACLERALAETTGQPAPSASSASAAPDLVNADEDARQLAELLQLQEVSMPTASATGAPKGQSSRAAQAAALYPASVLNASEETRTSLTSMASGGVAAALGRADQDVSAAVNIPINPTPNQQRVLESLVRRGQAMGWLIQLSEVTLGSVLGEGEFGVTYLGTWRHASVAVKVVRLRHVAELTSFLREVESMSYIRHPNVVPFLGACLSAPDKLSLVSEYMTGGSLSDYLHPGGMPAPGTSSAGLLNPPKPLLERLKMAHQVAQGMCALSSCRPAVLHRDLKPANVYLDQRGAPRVGDFGLSRRLLDGVRSSLTGETGTYLYMAPEVMRHEVYDEKADVWSWGVLLSECITCAMPYGHTYMTPVQVAMAVSEEQLAPLVPSNVHEEVQLVLRLACQFDPEMRPDFSSLADMLGSAIKHMEAQEITRPTLLASIQASLLGSWSGAWGASTSHPRQRAASAKLSGAGNPQQNKQPQQQQQQPQGDGLVRMRPSSTSM